MLCFGASTSATLVRAVKPSLLQEMMPELSSVALALPSLAEIAALKPVELTIVVLSTAFIESQTRLHVFHLPTYSPDWNPDEKVWNHLKHQELKGHQAKTKSELTQLTQEKLTSMANDPQLLRGIFFRCCVADILQ